MQRKNSILKHSHHGMAMIMAIGVIVIIGTIMTLALSMTSLTTKQTNDLYLHEQVLLYSKSATEYALLRIAQDNNSTNPCKFSGTSFVQDTMYNITISVRYVYNTLLASCPADTIIVTTPEQDGSAFIDVAVSITDPAISSEPIRYFRRTIQKL